MKKVVDFIQIVNMKEFGYTVIMDVTHSRQRQSGGVTIGNPHYVPYITKVAKAVGVDGYFMEVHSNLIEALSNGSNMFDFITFKRIIGDII